MNFGEFEASVRTSVDDAITDGVDTNATWSTQEIAGYLNRALSNYSQHFPREQMADIEVVAGTQSYDLPVDIIQPPDSAIQLIRWRRPGYQYDHMSRLDWPPGSTEAISVSGSGMGYYLWGGKLILADAPITLDATYNIELWYHALHTLVDTSNSQALQDRVLTVPLADEELLTWYVSSCMMGKLEASDAELRQWADRSDAGIYRDDNPARRSAQWRMDMYLDGIALRLGKKRAPKLRKR